MVGGLIPKDLSMMLNGWQGNWQRTTNCNARGMQCATDSSPDGLATAVKAALRMTTQAPEPKAASAIRRNDHEVDL